ncbi:proton-coupled zinc antiporter SLC30A8-like [Drosophila suzukii]|uniref:Proton-coupled zinc antiporter SLC30A8-like n=1 Tax=Drosophila suzukii TaxID=28584 RepID=A0ABM4TY31_DROSZ
MQFHKSLVYTPCIPSWASLEGVRSVHHLNVWQQSTQLTVMMVHLVTDSRTDGRAVLQAASELVSGSRYNINHATIQIEQTTAQP